MSGELLKTAEVARRLRLDPRTVRHLATNGTIKAYLVAGEYRFDAAAVNDFLTQHKVEASR